MKKSNEILLPEFERLINNGHTVEFTPQGVSMRPFIEGGRDSVLLKRPKRRSCALHLHRPGWAASSPRA